MKEENDGCGFYSLAFWQGLAKMRMALGAMRGVNGETGVLFKVNVDKLVEQAKKDAGLDSERRNKVLVEKLEGYSHGNSRENSTEFHLRKVGMGLYYALFALYDCHPSPEPGGISYSSRDREFAHEVINNIFKKGLIN